MNGVVLDSAKCCALLRFMCPDELAHLVDDLNAVPVTVALSHSPGKQAVAAENDAFRTRVFVDRPFNQECEFEPWTLPR